MGWQSDLASAKRVLRVPRSLEDARLLLNQLGNTRHSLHFRSLQQQLEKHQSLFDTVESKPLTQHQRLAVLLNEKRNLVIAGAGTGKTSVITAKVAYLVKEGLAKPEELLLLAYNTRAAKEMRDRLASRLGIDVTVRTFHSLGNEILGHVYGEKPRLSKLAEDQQKKTLNRFLQTQLSDFLGEEKLAKDILKYFSLYLRPSRSPDEFSSEREYRAYTRSLDLWTFQGERVKSHGELDTANFLFCNGVRYEYEARYRGDVPKNALRRTYQPDFFLPDYGIYLEYFGVDREGNTAPWIDKEKYQELIEWKRKTHEANGTTLLEIESFHRSEGRLEEVLAERLGKLGVTFHPRTPEEIIQAADERGYPTLLLKLVASFIEHTRSNGWTLPALYVRAATLPDLERSRAFLRIFQKFLAAYENELTRTGTIDFSQMISEAVDAISSGKWTSPFKYILIDEFQDLSVGRYKLVEALLRQHADCQLFAVGDDWQTIYRFAGSDISLMTGFRKHFRTASQMQLDRTFRFNSGIESVSTCFVTKNRRQIKKRLVGTEQVDSPRVFCHWRAADPATQILDVVRTMVQRHDPTDKSLLILARYNHDLPDPQAMKEIRSTWPSESIHASTVHRAKGTEADYVLLVDLVSGKYGFPSEIEDDPLLDIVLAQPEKFPAAEERRLFYVAITRARHAAHLIASEGEPSNFALELKDAEYLVSHDEPDARYRCPSCEIGILRRFRSGSGFGCTNFPECEYVAPDCPECGDGFLWRPGRDAASGFRCSEESCNGTAQPCPKCGKGALVPKTGRHGPFMGCSDWQTCVPGTDQKSLHIRS